MKKIVLFIIFILFITGCSNSLPKEEVINIEAKINENKHVLQRCFLYYSNITCDIRKVDEETDLYKFYENIMMESYNMEFNCQFLLYVKFYLGYTSLDPFPLFFEFNTEDEAKEIYPFLSIYFIDLKRDKNVIYFDCFISHILLGNFNEIDGLFYTKDNKMILNSPSRLDNVQNGTAEYISGYGFIGNNFIKSLTFNENLKEIGDYSFAYCKSLKSITFENGIERIGENAFSGCSSLEYVILPKGIKVISEGAFTNGVIFSEESSKPFKWDNGWISSDINVYWSGEWYYDDNGIPRANNFNDLVV